MLTAFNILSRDYSKFVRTSWMVWKIYWYRISNIYPLSVSVSIMHIYDIRY